MSIETYSDLRSRVKELLPDATYGEVRFLCNEILKHIENEGKDFEDILIDLKYIRASTSGYYDWFVVKSRKHKLHVRVTLI